MTATLGEVVAALEARYDPALAEDWDAVGLVCGDPDEPVARVLFAVDPVVAVVDEVVETGAQLLVTHHPLFLTAVHGVPADDPKGRLVHRLVRAGAVVEVPRIERVDVHRPVLCDGCGFGKGHDGLPGKEVVRRQDHGP